MFPQGTPFDLQMHVLRIPVRVIPTFWLVAALLDWNPDRFDLMAIWMICMFFSILIHELGHALTAEAFGYDPHIVLHHFGGYAAYHPGYEHTHVRALLISLAGPFAQLALAAVFIFAAFAVPWNPWAPPQQLTMTQHRLSHAITSMLFINIAWPILNLLPILPLDGGRILESILGIFQVRQYTEWALKVSMVAGGLCAVGAFQLLHAPILAIMLALMAFDSYQQLQARRW
jgi:Zn-dependent protease